MVTLSEALSPRPSTLWSLVKQSGVTDVIGFLNGGEQDQRMFQSVGADPHERIRDGDAPWSLRSIRADVATFAEAGLRVVGMEDHPPLDLARMGAPGRDEQIDAFITQIRAMGSLGIPLQSYNWMALTSWSRTTIDRPGRGDSRVTAYRTTDAQQLPTIDVPDGLDHEKLWDALRYFLDAVLPVAEEEGVVLAIHPDDPPVPVVRNVPRIMSSFDSFRKVMQLSSSSSNAITYCQGNFALMTDDVPAGIREFGEQGKIAFIHFRDVRGHGDDFEEVFHDEGQTDMAACLEEYHRLGIDVPMRPDHVPTMAGESNDRPGYENLGRIFAIGYIRGLEHGIAQRHAKQKEGTE